MQYSISQVADILGGTLLLRQNMVVDAVSVDSRNAANTASVLFFCLAGERHNGHHFIEQCYAGGVRNFVVSEKVDFSKYNEANFIEVPDTLAALQQLAQYHRCRFHIPVIGITGSNGKTIIKEWLYQLLSMDKNVVKSPKSYNSQVGVPLSVLNMEAANELAIFEAGISTVSQMHLLEKIIQPTIGIFSNIGPAHDAGFGSVEEKIEEKLQLFKHCDTLIYGAAHAAIHQKLKENKNTVYWKIIAHKNTDYQIEIVFNAKKKTQILSLDIHFKDKASVENCVHGAVAMLVLGYEPAVIQERIALLKNLPMRLELKYGINQCTIIDDAYSADFLSLQIAIDFVNQQETKKKKTLILSDFEESGLTSSEFIDKLNKITKQNRFDKLIGVGKFFVEQHKRIENIGEIFTFKDTETLLSSLDDITFFNELILVKGARKFEFEKILEFLIGQTHETVLEINLNSLINNLNVYKNIIGKNVGIIAMVKAFSYGNGSIELASLLEQHKVSYLAVAYADEGVWLRRNGIKTPILVMNPDKADFGRMLQFNLEPEIYSLKILRDLIKAVSVSPLGGAGGLLNIHLKIETGMNRLGFSEAEIGQLVDVLHSNPNVCVKTVFSHLAGSDDAIFDDFTKEQISKFDGIAANIEKMLGYTLKKHILNSAGIVRFPQAQYDFVRLGIGLYGVDGSATIQEKLELIGRLKTRIAQIKTVRQYETIGYSRRGVVNRAAVIGTLAIGYADGFDRRFGNGVGEVFVSDKRAKIIGNVCMDMCMADLTNLEDVKEGDEVEIYGKHISIIEQAKKIGTIPYELLTSISSRVKRVYFLE
jgi:alanine racemase